MKIPYLKPGPLAVAGVLLLLSLVLLMVSVADRKVKPVDIACRMRVECPDVKAPSFSVELGNLRSHIALDRVTGVVDRKGRDIPWRLSQDRTWVVFDGAPGDVYDIIIGGKGENPSAVSREPMPGMLTLTWSGVWVRKGDGGGRQTWWAGRLSRLVGAEKEARGSAAIEPARKAYANQLQALGINQLKSAPPFDVERRLVAQQPDFTKLLGQALKAELEARAEIFVTARRVLGNGYARSQPADTAEIRPWDVAGFEGVAAALRGRMYIEEPTTVMFFPYSLFGGVLNIDGRPVATIRLSRQKEAAGWRVPVPVKLSAGFHDIELIAQGRQLAFKAGLNWIPPKERCERHMVAGDFAPAPQARVLGLVSANRSRHYPLVRFKRIGRTGFFEQASYWSKLTSVSGDVTWDINGRPAAGATVTVCSPAGTPVEIGLYGKKFSIVPDKKKYRYLGGSVDAVPQLPAFLFQDECLSGQAVLMTESMMPLDIHLAVTHLRKRKSTRALIDKKVELHGRGSESVDGGEPAARQVLDFDLDGGKLRPGDALRMRAYCLPEYFLDECINVISPEACAGVRSNAAGCLVDASGHRVLIRLTRPSLGDKRRWGIVKGVVSSVRSPGRLLVVASPEEWGGERFRAALEKRGGARGCVVKIEPWVQPPAGVPRLLASLGSVSEQLRSGDFDAVLFIPSLADLAEGENIRTLARAAACLAEMAVARVGRQRVWLALPPGWAPDQARSGPFDHALRKVIGDYGIHAVPLATWIQSDPGKLEAAYEDAGIIQPGPVGLYSEVAAYLMDWIYGGAQ